MNADVAVVIATRNRAARLATQLDAIGAQAHEGGVEVVVVDDGSDDDTPAVLAQRPEVTVVRNDVSLGPGPARDRGWRASTAPLVVFTDDDCIATPEWLRELLAVARTQPGAVVMGRTEPEPGVRRSPFTHTVLVTRAGPPYETCNILYPRALLERLDGFDLTLEGTYPGEDTDLGWRAEQAGAPVLFAPRALVHHAVVPVGPLGKLRLAVRWRDSVALFRRHPGLRHRHLHHGLFFAPTHEQLLLAIVALALPRRWWPVRLVLAAPYARHLAWRRTGPLLAPWLIVYDVVETGAIVAGAIKARTLVV